MINGISNLISAKKGTLIIFLWLTTFAIGVAVPSPPFRNRLVEYGLSFGPDKVGGKVEITSNLSFPKALAYLATVFVSFTPTNVAILCVLGALLGAKAKAKETNRASATKSEARKPVETVALPALNGLCVFLALLTGQIVVQGELKWDDTAPNMYFRLAATATLFSVIAGTNPNFISDLARYFSLPKRADEVQESDKKLGKRNGEIQIPHRQDEIAFPRSQDKENLMLDVERKKAAPV
jgi:hypothetical protein